LASSSTLKMEAVCFPKRRRISTGRYSTEDSILITIKCMQQMTKFSVEFLVNVIGILLIKEVVLGRTNRLLSFDTTWTV
jgi:hypothetical protein